MLSRLAGSGHYSAVRRSASFGGAQGWDFPLTPRTTLVAGHHVQGQCGEAWGDSLKPVSMVSSCFILLSSVSCRPLLTPSDFVPRKKILIRRCRGYQFTALSRCISIRIHFGGWRLLLEVSSDFSVRSALLFRSILPLCSIKSPPLLFYCPNRVEVFPPGSLVLTGVSTSRTLLRALCW